MQTAYPEALIVHRLDMATSGLLILARGKAMQRRLSTQFANRQVDKRYVAVVNGLPPLASGEIDLPLAADWPNRPHSKNTLGSKKFNFRLIYKKITDLSQLKNQIIQAKKAEPTTNTINWLTKKIIVNLRRALQPTQKLK